MQQCTATCPNMVPKMGAMTVHRDPPELLIRSRTGMKKNLKLFALLLGVALCAPVWGQNPNGALRGTVQDPTGARVASATVVVRVAGAAQEWRVAANERGEFRIEDLLPGSYLVAVTAKDFAEATADVDVAVSTVRDIAVTLKPESVRETVNVPGNS